MSIYRQSTTYMWAVCVRSPPFSNLHCAVFGKSGNHLPCVMLWLCDPTSYWADRIAPVFIHLKGQKVLTEWGGMELQPPAGNMSVPHQLRLLGLMDLGPSSGSVCVRRGVGPSGLVPVILEVNWNWSNLGLGQPVECKKWVVNWSVQIIRVHQCAWGWSWAPTADLAICLHRAPRGKTGGKTTRKQCSERFTEWVVSMAVERTAGLHAQVGGKDSHFHFACLLRRTVTIVLFFLSFSIVDVWHCLLFWLN